MHSNWINKAGIKYKNESFILNLAMHSWGHLFIFDFNTLNSVLSDIGFGEIKQFECQKSDDENLVNYDELKFSYKEDDLTQSISILKNNENFYLNNKNQISLPKFTYIYSNFDNINQFSSEIQLTDEIKNTIESAIKKTIKKYS